MDAWADRIIQSLPNANSSNILAAKHNKDTATRSRSDSTQSTLVETNNFGSFEDIIACQQGDTEAATPSQWRLVLAMIAGVLQQTLCWGMVMTYGSILTFYTDHLLPTSSKTLISLIGVLPAFIVFSTALFWGRLLDAGHHRRINFFGTCFLTAGLIGLAFTAGNGSYGDGQYWQILLASIPIGIGQSALFLAAPHMAKTWLPRRKGLAMGITNSGSAIGGIIWPFVFTRLTAAYSFRAGVGMLALIAAVLGAFVVYACTPGPSFQRRAMKNKSNLCTWLPAAALRSVTFRLHMAAMCSMYAGLLTIPFFIEYWAQKNNIAVSEDGIDGTGIAIDDGPRTVYLVVILNACQTPGRLLGSSLCDKFRARKLHVLACLLAVAVIVPSWLLISTFPEACTFAAIFGLTLGVMVSLPNNDIADIMGPTRPHLFGQFAGIVYTVAGPFLLGGAAISGALIDRSDSRMVVFWTMTCFSFCAIFIVSSLLVPEDTWKLDGQRNSVSSGNTLMVGKSEKHLGEGSV